MNESTETMNATGADPIAELHRAPNGRRALRYAEMSRWQVFRLPRATDRGGRRSRPSRLRSGQDPKMPSANASRANVAAAAALEDAARQGAKSRGVRAYWQRCTQVVEGQRVRPLTATGRWYECVEAGVTGDKEPAWSTIDVVVDGQVAWKPIPTWEGRQGYGSLGMKEVCKAMRMHPYALAATPEERRKERSAARSLRQKRAA